MTSGIILLDKPIGLSSNAALQRVKRLAGAGKAGHAGTLDPLATGMLPILLGEATKVAGHLLHKDKAYQVECRLGQVTDTYDAEGEVIAEAPVPTLDAAMLRRHLDAFTGTIRQQAPAYSAIKQGGLPLYKRVRRGEEVVAPVREVVIRRIDLEAVSETSLTLTVECGSGTYIRSLVHDLGQALGCGGHVTALRRLWVDPFRDAPMASLDMLEPGHVPLLPALVAVSDWPRLTLDSDDLAAIEQGRRLARQVAPGLLAGVAPDGGLAAILESDGGGVVRSLRLLRRHA